MKAIAKLAVIGCTLMVSHIVKASDNVVLVTLDGVRWQEVFNGADQKLLANPDFVTARAIETTVLAR